MEKFGEYDPATPLGKTFCPRITVQQYEHEGTQETHDALQSLMEHMDKHPEVYKRVLAKRMKEEAENAGLMSYLKSKVLEAIQGENYMEASVTEEQTLVKLKNMQKEIGEAYDYAQEAKNSRRRFSKRLSSKRSSSRSLGNTSAKAAKKIPQKPARKTPPITPPYPPPVSYEDDVDGARPTLVDEPLARRPIRGKKVKSKLRKGGVPVPPPPPPPPGNFVKPHPLGERTNTINSPDRQITPKSTLVNTPKPTNLRKVSIYGSTTSLSSVGSVHDELMAFDKRKLKSVCNHRSNTGTPCHTPHIGNNVLGATPVCGKAVGNFGNECVHAFNSLMVDKFRNARSPPSAVNSPSSCFNSPSGFTP